MARARWHPCGRASAQMCCLPWQDTASLCRQPFALSPVACTGLQGGHAAAAPHAQPLQAAGGSEPRARARARSPERRGRAWKRSRTAARSAGDTRARSRKARRGRCASAHARARPGRGRVAGQRQRAQPRERPQRRHRRRALQAVLACAPGGEAFSRPLGRSGTCASAGVTGKARGRGPDRVRPTRACSATLSLAVSQARHHSTDAVSKCLPCLCACWWRALRKSSVLRTVGRTQGQHLQLGQAGEAVRGGHAVAEQREISQLGQLLQAGHVRDRTERDIQPRQRPRLPPARARPPAQLRRMLQPRRWCGLAHVSDRHQAPPPSSTATARCGGRAVRGRASQPCSAEPGQQWGLAPEPCSADRCAAAAQQCCWAAQVPDQHRARRVCPAGSAPAEPSLSRTPWAGPCARDSDGHAHSQVDRRTTQSHPYGCTVRRRWLGPGGRRSPAPAQRAAGSAGSVAAAARARTRWSRFSRRVRPLLSSCRVARLVRPCRLSTRTRLRKLSRSAAALPKRSAARRSSAPSASPSTCRRGGLVTRPRPCAGADRGRAGARLYALSYEGRGDDGRQHGQRVRWRQRRHG